jgi:putative ABC transport system permease protein
MKYARLIRANLFRKKIRTFLTIGSFAVALMLFALLAIVRHAFSGGVDVAGADRLVVINRVSIIQPLPLAYRDRMLRIPHVKEVTYFNWFGGVYQDERNFFPQFAIDVPTHRSMFPEFIVPDDQWNAFVADREGAIVGKGIADRFHWKVGDRIPLKGTIFPGVWEFNIRGIYTGKRDNDDTSQFWFHWDRLNEAALSKYWKDMVGWYTVKVDDPGNADQVVKTIDSEFSNSTWETKTETEKGFAAGWVKQMGNIEFLILSIGGVVFFTLLLVTGNTMATTVRERIRELAVMKAIGFSDTFVLWLVLAESLLIAVIGGAIGLGLGKAITLRGDPTGGILGIFYLPSQAIVLGFALAVAVGLIAGIMPATGAMRLRVVDAMRRI